LQTIFAVLLISATWKKGQSLRFTDSGFNALFQTCQPTLSPANNTTSTTTTLMFVQIVVILTVEV
jgi:hypothetical protein